MYDFDEVFVFVDVEGGHAVEEFVGEYADGPEIYFFVVA